MTDTAATADQIATDLRTIRTAWPDMLALTTAGMTAGGSDPARPPVPVHVLSVRRSTTECLASWARLVANERDLHANLDTADAHAAAGFLLTHADWLAAHEQASRVLRGLDYWAGKCADIVERNRVRRYQVGHCPETTVDEDGTELGPCPGNLWALIRETDDLLPRFVVCDGPEQHTWSPWQWPALGRRLGSTVAALTSSIAS